MGSIFLIAGEHFADSEPDFQRALAAAYIDCTRPRCLCKPEGIETCVAKAGDGFVVRRMPYTASKHAGSCPLARIGPSSRALAPRRRVLDDSRDFTTFRAESQALGTLLRSLWHAAGLTRWQPSFQGKRSWATVRRHLRTGSAGYDWRGGELGDCLYIPETFRLEEMHAIGARRDAEWARIAQRRVPRDLVMLIGEVKRIECATQGSTFVFKHMPDRPFVLSGERYVWIDRLCGDDAAFCEMFGDLHLVAIATVALSSWLAPALRCLHFMPTTAEWLPIRNGQQRATLADLISDGRSFVVDEALFGPRRGPRPRRPDPAHPSAAPSPAGRIAPSTRENRHESRVSKLRPGSAEDIAASFTADTAIPTIAVGNSLVPVVVRPSPLASPTGQSPQAGEQWTDGHVDTNVFAPEGGSEVARVRVSVYFDAL